MDKITVKNKKVNFSKLKQYGFNQKNDLYVYKTLIADDQFSLNITIDKNGIILTKVLDNDFNDEYVLHLIPSAVGEFVGLVREDYQYHIKNIIKHCFDTEVFKQKQTKEIIKYVNNKYGDLPEYLWPKFPNNAILRRKDNKKWYAVILTVKKSKLCMQDDKDKEVEIINLHTNPDMICQLIDNNKYFPAYHMNKKHWFSICLDNSVKSSDIKKMIDKSYDLTVLKNNKSLK